MRLINVNAEVTFTQFTRFLWHIHVDRRLAAKVVSVNESTGKGRLRLRSKRACKYEAAAATSSSRITV